MPATNGPDLSATAAALTRSHPVAPLLDALDLVFSDHAGAAVDWTAPSLQPAVPFGQMPAAARDRGMPPAEWVTSSLPPAYAVLRLARVTGWHECRWLHSWCSLS